MKYNKEYKDIFVGVRNALDEELKSEAKFMSYSAENGHTHSWSFIAIVANDLTAYNEISPLDFFIKLKNFL